MAYINPYQDDTPIRKNGTKGIEPEINAPSKSNANNVSNAKNAGGQNIPPNLKGNKKPSSPMPAPLGVIGSPYNKHNQHGIDNNNGWMQVLFDRGIGQDQIDYFDIRPGMTIFHDPTIGETVKDFELVEADPMQSTGFLYPMYYPQSNTTVHRLKHYPWIDDNAKVRSPKGFRMPGGKHPAFYIPSEYGLNRLKQAIADNDGVLIGVEGEPDNWALDAAGVYNVTAFFGWTNVPETLLPSLKWLGVKHFIYIADNDQPGIRGAQRVWNALYYADITSDVYITPTTYNGKPTKDTNDVLLAINYDRDMLYEYLNHYLPSNCRENFEEPRRGKFDGADLNRDMVGFYKIGEMVNDVVEILNVSNVTKIDRTDGDGWTNHTQCPMADPPHGEDDKKPAFGINVNTGACYCFKCGKHSIRDVARQLGLDLSQYKTDNDPIPPPDDWRQTKNELMIEAQSAEMQSAPSNTEGSGFFKVARERGAAIDYMNIETEVYVTSRKEIMRTAIRRAEGDYTDYSSFSVPWPMDDYQFLKLGGYCELMPAGKLIQLISSTGGGKCVRGDTLVSTKDGLKRIDSLIPSNVNSELDEEGGVFYPLEIEIQTPYGLKTTSHFYDGGIKPVKRVVSKHGYEVIATNNHPLLVIDKSICTQNKPLGYKDIGLARWKTLDSIEKGDCIAIHCGAGLFGNKDVIDNIYLKHISAEIAYILGLLIGAVKFTSEETVEFKSTDQNILNVVAEFPNILGLSAYIHKDNNRIRIISAELVRWLQDIGICMDSDKRKIPDFIFNMSKVNIGSFLSGLFDNDDGDISLEKLTVQYCSYSKELTRQLHLLLLQLGIFSELYAWEGNNMNNLWIININNKEVIKFHKNINFRMEDKKLKCDLMCECIDDLNSGSYYSDSDSDIIWDQVDLVEDQKEVNVYDLTVPNGHTFVGNGIVNHNTTFIKSLEMAFNEIGIHTLLWSPEFDEHEHGDQNIQMVSGVSSIRAMKNDQYWVDKMNQLDSSQFGAIFDEYERQRTVDAANMLINLEGESYIAKKFGGDVYNMLTMFELICDFALSQGHEIQVVFVDYAQLMQRPIGEKDWNINDSVLALKEWCNYQGWYVSPRDGQRRFRRRKVGIFTSQATKTATKAVQTGEQPYLTPEDAQELRPDWANLILSTKMGSNFTTLPDWGVCREYEIYVCKNSKGEKREYNDGNSTGPVKMLLSLNHLRIIYQSNRLKATGKSATHMAGNPIPQANSSLTAGGGNNNAYDRLMNNLNKNPARSASNGNSSSDYETDVEANLLDDIPSNQSANNSLQHLNIYKS